VKASGEVYEFRVVLLEVAPPIWRTIQVPGTYSFWDLHVALQDSMGWLDYHLHLFRVSRPGTDDAVQIGIPDEDAFEGDEPILPGWEVPIARYFAHPPWRGMRTISETGGNTRSLSTRSSRARKAYGIRAASLASGPVRRRTAGAWEATRTSLP
jgi:hypothetical protein